MSKANINAIMQNNIQQCADEFGVSCNIIERMFRSRAKALAKEIVNGTGSKEPIGLMSGTRQVSSIYDELHEYPMDLNGRIQAHPGRK